MEKIEIKIGDVWITTDEPFMKEYQELRKLQESVVIMLDLKKTYLTSRDKTDLFALNQREKYIKEIIKTLTTYQNRQQKLL